MERANFKTLTKAPMMGRLLMDCTKGKEYTNHTNKQKKACIEGSGKQELNMAKEEK